MLPRISLRRLLGCCLAAAGWLAIAPTPVQASHQPEIDAGFHLLYELKFAQARARFADWQKAHPEDPLGSASEAAAYLFEEFYAEGVLTSEFFLNDKRLLGGIAGKPNEQRRAAFFAANDRAEALARRALKANPKDANALFSLTIATGMHADYSSVIEKRQLESLRLIREAEGYAKNLLAIDPDSADAYLALGAGNYILGCLPAYKRAFLWLGGIHGDKPGGMRQLALAAEHGHYLRPFARILLALAALREKQVALARAQLTELTAEFPQNPLFARELAKNTPPRAGVPSSLQAQPQ